MTSPTRDRHRDEWELRWMPLVANMAYVLVAALAGFTAALKHSTRGPMLIDVSLCVAFALWMFWMYTLHPTWHERTSMMVLFVIGLIMLMAVLVIRDSWFGFLTPIGYFFAFNTLPRPWDVRCVALVAVVAATAQSSGVRLGTALGIAEYTAVVTVNVLPMIGLVWFGWNDDIQKNRREQALQEVNEANRRLEATLAENAGLHRQLITQAREAGVLDERARMAREIHDTLAQGLAGIVTQLQAAEHAAAEPDQWRRHFAAATRLARESLSEARRSVDALRPERLETTARLGDALSDVAERWSALHGIAAQVTTTGTARTLPPEAEFALLRTLQEALANVAKHAHASRVVVTLSYLEAEVALDVRDDGRGFAPCPAPDSVPSTFPEQRSASSSTPDPTSSSTPDSTSSSDSASISGGFGLIAMRQRIDALFGTLQIESEPGVGTTVSACVPQLVTEAGAPT